MYNMQIISFLPHSSHRAERNVTNYRQAVVAKKLADEGKQRVQKKLCTLERKMDLFTKKNDSVQELKRELNDLQREKDEVVER